MKTILLLVASNVFMTLAWYGHLKIKWLDGKSLWTVILVSWGIAFFVTASSSPPTAPATSAANLPATNSRSSRK